jgi:hypothetical protein
MRFKIVAFLVVMQLVSACGWVQDKPNNSKTLHVEALDKVDCLQTMPVKLQYLFEGKYTSSPNDQAEVLSIWGCLHDSLYAFKTFTYGAKPKSYSPDELRRFANNYFLSDRPLRPEMVSAIFKLKTAVIGGNEQELTVDEIDLLTAKLDRFAQIILPLAPYMDILHKQPDQNTDTTSTGKALNRFVVEFADLLADSKYPVKWADIQQFLSELEILTRVDKPTSLAAIKEQVPLYQYLKMILVGGNEFAIEPTKWSPIFKGLSHVYNAVFLSKTNTEIFNQLEIEVQSTDAERALGVQKLTTILKDLKKNPSITSKATVNTYASSWAELCLLNAFMFPQAKGSLALNAYFSSQAMRIRTGRLIDETDLLKTNDKDPKLIGAISRDLKSLIQISFNLDMPTSDRDTTLSLAGLKEYAKELKPLFVKETDYDFIIHAIEGFAAANQYLNHTDANALTSADLNSLITKAADLYQLYVIDLMPVGSARTAAAKTAAADAEAHGSFAEAKIADLIPIVDTFLPEGKKIASYGFSPKEIGELKSVLVGGNAETIGPKEYVEFAHLAGAISNKVLPLMDALPKGFEIGLNARTMAIAKSALEAFVETRKGQISNEMLKDLLVTYLNTTKPPREVKALSIQKLLTGFTQRIFFGDHVNPKLPTMPQGFSAPQLGVFVGLLDQLALDYADIEKVYAGVPDAQYLDRATLNRRLTRAAPKTHIKFIRPVLNGANGLPYLSPTSFDQYYKNDLMFKTLVYDGLTWAFPKYKMGDYPGTTPDGIQRISEADELDLLTDIDDFTYDVGLVYSNTPPEVTAKLRTQTINLFTQSGNGDDYIDAIETTEFFTLSLGARGLFDGVLQELAQKCYQRKDYMNVPKYSVACINDHFFAGDFIQRHYGAVIPEMAKEYTSLNSDDKEQFKKAVLSATDPLYETKGEILFSDMETMVSTLTFAENIFLKLDTNRDGVLVYSELMRGFPVFCGAIHEAAGSAIKGSCVPGEDPGQIEAVYGYLLINGVPPRGIKPGDSIFRKVKEALSFLKWAKYWKNLPRDSESRDGQTPVLKRKDLLNIISNLSASIAPAPDASTDDPSTNDDGANAPDPSGSDDPLTLALPAGAQLESP